MTEYPICKDKEVLMVVIWGGTLAVLLKQLWKAIFKIENISVSVEQNTKRIGVYYMCIDDLPL